MLEEKEGTVNKVPAKVKGTHGGVRPGSGRKRLRDPIVIYSVRITHAQAETLKQWGGGDLSAGLRWLIDAAEILVKRTQPKVRYTIPTDLST